MKDYTQLTPTQRLLVLSVKRHKPEPRLDKPRIQLNWAAFGFALFAWIGVYLLGHIVLAIYRGLP